MSEQNKINISVIIGTVALIVSMLTSIFFTPFLLQTVGDADYGLKSLSDSFVAFVSVLTTSMASVFIRFHKKYGLKGEGKVLGAFSIIFLVIAGIMVVFGLVLLGLTWGGVLLPSDLYTQDQVHTFAVILSITLLYTVLSTLLGLFNYYDQSNKMLILVRVIDLLVVIGYPAISIPLLLNGGNIIGVTLVYCLVYFAGYVGYAIFAIRKRRQNVKEHPEISKVSKSSFSLIKEILVFSLATVLISVSVTINSSIDKVILGSFSGAEAVTIFQLSMTLNQVLLSASSVLYVPYLPAATEGYVDNDMKKVQSIFTRCSTVLAFISFSILFGFIFAGQDFVNAWVGEDYSQVYLNTIIIFAFWPVYGIARFSDSLSKCADRQKMMIVIFATGLALHLVITLSTIWFIDMWACVIGLSASMLYISIASFIFDVKVLKVSIKPLMINLIKFLIAGGVAIGICFLLDHFALAGHYPSNYWLSTIVKCLMFVALWILMLVALFFKETKAIWINMFIDQEIVDDNGNKTVKLSSVSKIKKKFRKKDKE